MAYSVFAAIKHEARNRNKFKKNMKYKNPKATKLGNTKNIEDLAIQYVVEYLKKIKKYKKIRIIKKGVDLIADKDWIEVKGCLRKESNIRIVPQAIDYVAEAGKLKDFYIYYVYGLSSQRPKLTIFDYKTFKKYKVIEIKYIIQPFKIIRETGKPEVIGL